MIEIEPKGLSAGQIKAHSGSSTFLITVANKKDRDCIYAMRHRIYAEELGQHAINEQRELRDHLDEHNSYIIAKKDNEIVGFVSITTPGAESFSVDKYFERSAIPVPFDRYLFEIRLLSVIKKYRRGALALLLMYAAKRWVESHGGEYIIAICRSDIIKMYLNSGLKTLGQSARAGNVLYELAFASIEDLNKIVSHKRELFESIKDKTAWTLLFPFFAPVACYHGGAFFAAIGEDLQHLHRRHKIINADVLDAWFPPSPRVVSAIQDNLSWLLQTSPPTHNKGLISAIATARGVADECILPGAGSSDLIFLGLHRLLHAKSKVLLLDPCYGEYRFVLEQIIGCEVTPFSLLREDGFMLDTDKLALAVGSDYDMVVLVNPNSPTGRHVSRRKMEDFLRQISSSTLIWIDETYVEYAGAGESLEQFAITRENVIICKSMSKVYALSGVRVAYLCAAPHLLELLRLHTPPWAVSLPAQLAAITALQDEEYYRERYRETHLLRETLSEQLNQLGIDDIIPGVANFLLFYLAEATYDSSVFLERCKSAGLFIRDVSNMGVPLGKMALRIAIKDNHTNQKMLEIIRQALQASSATVSLSEGGM